MTLNITNLDRLISHLEGLPEERFHMRHTSPDCHECGTACCLGGHVGIIEGTSYDQAFEFFGDVSMSFYASLYCPEGWINERDDRKAYPLSRAIRTLKHMRAEFLRTGQVVVDWDAPEPAARKDWVAPQAVERVLPAEITKLLTPTVRAEVL